MTGSRAFGSMLFQSEVEKVAEVTPLRSIKEIAHEPAVLLSSWEYTRAATGPPITNEILDALETAISLESPDPDYPHLAIDTRVHQLMPTHIPAIPGWHCDWAPRSGYKSQPDPQKSSPLQMNYTVLISTEKNMAPTEFITDPINRSLRPSKCVGLVTHRDREDVACTGQDVRRRRRHPELQRTDIPPRQPGPHTRMAFLPAPVVPLDAA